MQERSQQGCSCSCKTWEGGSAGLGGSGTPSTPASFPHGEMGGTGGGGGQEDTPGLELLSLCFLSQLPPTLKRSFSPGVGKLYVVCQFMAPGGL